MRHPFAKIRKPNGLDPRPHKKHAYGYSLPEVMIASVIMAGTVTMSAQLSNSTVEGMQQMNLRSKLDSAMAARMEDIRDAAFRYLCTQGCKDDELTLQLKYNLSSLEPLCTSNTLGTSLHNNLESTLKSDFNLISFDPKAPSKLIKASVTPNGNQINVTLNFEGDIDSSPISISSIIVPHAQGWCP